MCICAMRRVMRRLRHGHVQLYAWPYTLTCLHACMPVVSYTHNTHSHKRKSDAHTKQEDPAMANVMQGSKEASTARCKEQCIQQHRLRKINDRTRIVCNDRKAAGIRVINAAMEMESSAASPFVPPQAVSFTQKATRSPTANRATPQLTRCMMACARWQAPWSKDGPHT